MEALDVKDYLTGLYNRKGIAKQYEDLPQGSIVHVMFCDLDNFKSVNDIYGHAAGDQLLVAFAELLRKVSPNAIVGRLGGDEFIMAFTGEYTKDELSKTAASIIHELHENRKKLQFLTMVSVSIGIVWGENTDSGLDQILYKSDLAMYQAKQRGKSCYLFYDELEERIRMESAMESQANEALETGMFKLRFLPVINMQNSRLEQAELRVLWEKKEGGFWTEEEYVPVLERTGFICKLDEYVVRKLCERLQYIHKQGREHGKISICLSRLTYLEDGLAERLIGILDQYGVAQEDIRLGINEKSFEHRDRSQVLQSMNKLKNSGFSMEMKSFGETFSSFRYLRQLPIDAIHFESYYLKENMKTSRGCQIIKTLIRLGKDLKQTMIADGITEKEELIFLMACGCDAASGSYYSEMLDEEDYLYYARDRIKTVDNQIAYAFKNDLLSTDRMYAGRIIGDGVRYVDGISDNWGGLYFPGGHVGENLVSFSGQLFSGNSFTISLWIRPEAIWTWASVVYAQFMAGFVSIVPHAGEGISIFRICEEEDLNGWHDVLTHSPDLHKWTFITVTYDAMSESMRYYFNAQKAGYQVNVPMMYACSEVMLGGDAFQKAFTGTVSAFMVSDRAKTEEEVAELYNSYLAEPGFCGDLDVRTQLENNRARMLRADITDEDSQDGDANE